MAKRILLLGDGSMLCDECWRQRYPHQPEPDYGWVHGECSACRSGSKMMAEHNKLTRGGIRDLQADRDRLRAVNAAMVVLLETAVARVKQANDGGYPILSAWRPDAEAAIARAKEQK